MTIADARDTTRALLAARAPDATLCPSEVARVIAVAGGATERGGWRAAMPIVHAAIDGMVADGIVRLSWKGEPLVVRSGPYRVGRGRLDGE